MQISEVRVSIQPSKDDLDFFSAVALGRETQEMFQSLNFPQQCGLKLDGLRVFLKDKIMDDALCMYH